MDRLAFNAVAAINEQRLSRQMTINELANVTTVGFKRSYEASMRAVKIEGPGMESRFQPQAVASDIVSMKPGELLATGRPLDIAMNQYTVLGVTAANGDLGFSRRGDLRVNAAGVLEDGVGRAVRSQGGDTITIPPGFLVTVNPDGSLYATDPSQAGAPQPVLIGSLLLRDSSKTPLERREDGLYSPVGKPGTDIANGSILPSVTPKVLEGSNVNAMEIMVKLMDQSRSFEHQVRNIKESKTTDEAGATMMKLA